MFVLFKNLTEICAKCLIHPLNRVLFVAFGYNSVQEWYSLSMCEPRASLWVFPSFSWRQLKSAFFIS